MLKKIIIFLSILLIPLFFIFSIFDISEKNNLTSIFDSSYNVKENEEYTPDPYIDSVEIDSFFWLNVFVNDSDYAHNHYMDIQIKFAELDQPVLYNDYNEGIVDVVYVSKIFVNNEGKITYSVYNLDPFTTYHIEYISIDNDSDTWTSVDNFTFAYNYFPYVQDIEVVDDSITSNSVQIKARFISGFYTFQQLIEGVGGYEEEYDINFWLKLENYDELLSIGNPIDDITLTYDENIYLYSNVLNQSLEDESLLNTYSEGDFLFTISGLNPSTTYTIKESNIYFNDADADYDKFIINNFDLSFTTLETPATVNSIEIIDESITDSSAQIKVTTSTTNFNADDLVLHLEDHDGDLTTSTPVDGITLTNDSTNETEIIYTISGLEQEIQYTITSAELNGTEKTIDVSFTTGITPAAVSSIQVVTDLITDSSAQIKVTTSTTNFNAGDLVLHLEGYDGDLTTSTPVDGITLTNDSTNETEIIYTISGLEQETQYTITSAELNGNETTVEVSFKTEISLAIVNSIEVIDDSITDSSAQIKVATSTTNFNVDDLSLQLVGHDGDLTTSTPVDGITLTNDSTNETEIYYTISGLAQGTQYTIVSAELNDTEKVINESFTTAISLAKVTNIEIVADSITDSSAQIKVTTSTTNFNVDDLSLQLVGHDGDLTTSTPVDGITLTNDSTNGTEIYYTISGLAQGTQYTITSAEFNGIETTVEVSFTTEISLAIVNSIEVIDDSITDSSAQIKVTTSTTNFNEDDLILHLDGYDEELTIENSIEGISLNYIATSNTSIYYTISGLDSNTQYTITSAELNDISANDIDLSFTTLETPATVNSIEIIDESITDSSAQIKVTTSTTNFDENDLILHLANHDGDLTTTTPVDGITLTHDSTDETEIYYTILGLESEQEFTITNAKLNNVEKNIDLSFTTKRTEIENDSLSPTSWIIIEIIILLMFLIICYLIFI
ncbi:MAG: hypothetical protein TYPL_3970 [Candidatus Tyloplasma litorale]|nr:MAG: hypothetical protein TYPL_3970 [Mycoplasmatales bacterium]